MQLRVIFSVKVFLVIGLSLVSFSQVQAKTCSVWEQVCVRQDEYGVCVAWRTVCVDWDEMHPFGKSRIPHDKPLRPMMYPPLPPQF